MGLYSVPDENAIQKQLDATLAAGATSMTLSEDISSKLSEISADNPMEIVIDRVDASGNLTTTKREYVTATGVSAAVISGLTRNADGSGSDQEHAVGAIVEFVPGVLWAQQIKDLVISTDGTQTLTNKTIDGDDNTVQDIPASALKSTTGSDTAVVTGTAGTDTYVPQWNADGDIVDGYAFLDEDDMATDSATAVASQQSVKAYAGKAAIEFVIDGGGAALSTGIAGDLEIPFACEIEAVTALADQSGSVVVDIWKDTLANYPPTDGDSITASAPATITTDTDSQDSTLTGWTTAITAGDTLRYNVDSVTDITRVVISLKILKA